MATSDDIKYSYCSPCLDDGRNTTARHHCVDCEMYFCTKCVKCHKTIPILRTHQVNNVNVSDSTALYDETTVQGSDHESVPSLRCSLHQGKIVDTYCKAHDELCCGTCAVVKHRSCTTVSIAIAAKDFKASPELNKCKESLTENIVKLTEVKEKQIKNIESIDEQKLDLIKTVDKDEEKIISKIKELANITRKEIRSKCEERKTALGVDIEALNVVLTTTTKHVDQLEQTDDEQLFVTVKTSTTITKDGEMLLHAMTTDWIKREIRFYLDETLDNQVIEMKSFGRLEEDCAVKEYTATFQRNINVKRGTDSYDTYVYDVCLMESGELLLTDYNNKKLKRFNSDLQYKDEVMLSGNPVALCKIDKHEVAVRIYSTKVVHFVSVGQSMQLTSSFTLDGNGIGLTYDIGTGEIFACEGNKVSVYSKTGHKHRTYDNETNGEQLFASCRRIALSVNKQFIYVTDFNNGLVVLDKSGHLKMKVSSSGITGTFPLCLLPGHMCLVGSRSSGVIVQIDKYGKEVGKLIDSTDGRKYTYCAVYDRKQSILVVGGYPSVISIYKLSNK